MNLGSIASISENEGYTNNIDQITTLPRQSITPMQVEVKNTVDAYISVWIDYDRNGSFADVGEVVYQGMLLEGSGNPLLETEVLVPADARIGATRMRVIAQKEESANPCDPIYFGEVEYYGIFLDEATNTSVTETIPLTVFPNPFLDEITIN